MGTSAKNLIRNNIRQLRLERGYTQKQLAEMIGKTVPTIANIENGRSVPNIYNLEAIAKALNVPMQDLFDSDGEKPRELSEREKTELKIRKMLHELTDLDIELVYRQTKVLLELRKEETS